MKNIERLIVIGALAATGVSTKIGAKGVACEAGAVPPYGNQSCDGWAECPESQVCVLYPEVKRQDNAGINDTNNGAWVCTDNSAINDEQFSLNKCQYPDFSGMICPVAK